MAKRVKKRIIQALSAKQSAADKGRNTKKMILYNKYDVEKYLTKHNIEFKTVGIMESFPKELGKVTDPANFWVMSHDTYEHKSQLYFLSTTLGVR